MSTVVTDAYDLFRLEMGKRYTARHEAAFWSQVGSSRINIARAQKRVFNRTAGPWCPNEHLRINDSVEITTRYVLAAARVCRRLVAVASKYEQLVCPFKLHLDIVNTDPIIRVEDSEESDEFDESDDDDDEDEDYARRLSEIEEKRQQTAHDATDNAIEVEPDDIAQWLRANHVEFESVRLTPCYPDDFEFMNVRHLWKLLKSYVDLSKKSDKYCAFPHKKELIFVVDPRSHPHNDVYVHSSPKCRFKGKGTLSFSFEVREADRIRAYLSWNNQTIRFLPRNLQSIFSSIFDMDWNNTTEGPSENERFLKHHMAHLIEAMEACLKDHRLDKFLAWCDANNQ